jgi:hypothetical protein
MLLFPCFTMPCILLHATAVKWASSLRLGGQVPALTERAAVDALLPDLPEEACRRVGLVAMLVGALPSGHIW